MKRVAVTQLWGESYETNRFTTATYPKTQGLWRRFTTARDSAGLVLVKTHTLKSRTGQYLEDHPS